MLKEAASKVQHVATLWNPDNQGTIIQSKRMQETALTLGLQMTALSVRPADIENSLAVLACRRSMDSVTRSSEEG
jgi:putative ABC transport system substrate-binding protein